MTDQRVMFLQRQRPLALALISLALITVIFGWRLQLLETRTFDPDEFEHLHAAWSVHQGLVPYRDFFEHHMPGLYYLLSWMIGAVHPAVSRENLIQFVFAARTIMWCFSLCSVILTIAVARTFDGPAVGWTSGALLCANLVFVGRTLEIRPDVPGLVLVLGFILALLGAVRAPRSSPRRTVLFAVSGLCLGGGLLFNQKLLLAGPGIAALTLIYLTTNDAPLAERMKNILAMLAATLAPLLLIGLVFTVHGALINFVRGTLLDNLTWGRELSAGSTIRWLLLRDPLFSGLAAAGLVWGIFDLLRRPSNLSSAAITLPTLSLLVGLFITPTPFPQYLLPLVALGAVLAAHFLWNVVSEWPFSRTAPQERIARWAAVLFGTIVASMGLLIARPFFVAALVYPIFGLAVLASAAVMTMRQRPEWALAILIVGCSAYSLQQLRWMQGLSNGEAIAEMRYVYDTTTATDDVLDGFSGVAWFRPNAFKYWFLHPGMRARLTRADVESLLDTVHSCSTRPKMIILDDHLERVSPQIAPFVAGHYSPSPYPTIWVRKEPCVQ